MILTQNGSNYWLEDAEENYIISGRVTVQQGEVNFSGRIINDTSILGDCSINCKQSGIVSKAIHDIQYSNLSNVSNSLDDIIVFLINRFNLS